MICLECWIATLCRELYSNTAPICTVFSLFYRHLWFWTLAGEYGFFTGHIFQSFSRFYWALGKLEGKKLFSFFFCSMNLFSKEWNSNEEWIHTEKNCCKITKFWSFCFWNICRCLLFSCSHKRLFYCYHYAILWFLIAAVVYSSSRILMKNAANFCNCHNLILCLDMHYCNKTWTLDAFFR